MPVLRALLVVMTLALAGALAGCATGRNPELLSAILRARVTDVVVEVPPAIGEGIPDLNGIPDKDKAPAVARAVQTSVVARVMGRPNGPEAARLRITLTALSVSSAAGRALGTSSFLKGTARLETMNGQLIAHLGDIVGEDRSTQMGGNIGAVITLASNIAAASTEDRIQKLSLAFAEKIEKAVLGP
jgi:hypothetical protein